MEKVKIDLGCGAWKKEGFTGIDILPAGTLYNGYPVNPDIIADLNKGIPLAADSVDEILCSHYFEHSQNIQFLVDEIYRVLVTGGTAEIIVPMFDWFSTGHLTCIFPAWHRRFFNSTKFNLLKNEIKEKDIDVDAGIGYCILEQTLIFEKI